MTYFTIFISRAKKISELKLKFCDLMKEKEIYQKEGLNINSIRLWKLGNSIGIELIKKIFSEKSHQIRSGSNQFKCGDLTYLEYDSESYLEDLELADTDVILVEYSTAISPWIFEIKEIEQKEGKCEWCTLRRILKYPCTCKEVWYCKQECLEKDKFCHVSRCTARYKSEENELVETDKSRKGLVGLQNIGNTCFMNTSLQCISNCYELTQYFLKDYFKKDINLDNPIGSQGVLAREYAKFLKNVWYGENAVYTPWNFKRAISNFQSMFSGYQQHDTQEFLNYLLDGLHEDLNRVLKKPQVEKDDSKKDDQIKSNEQWIGFLRRNQSTLVDLLYGQYKSTLYCPDQECRNVSTTFDPFLSVSLPLVSKTETYEVICFFIFYDIKNKPLQLTLPFSVETTIMALRNKVAKLLNVHPFSFFVIKMDSSDNNENILNSTSLLKNKNFYYSLNQKPFFLFQIDPELFYSNENSYCINNQAMLNLKRDFYSVTEEMSNREEENKKLFSDDYEEEEGGATSDSICYYSKINNSLNTKPLRAMRVNVDENNGFSNEYLKVIIHLKKYEEQPYLNKRSRIIFPRIIYLNKTWSTKRAHFYIFKYFAQIIREHNNLDEAKWPDDDLWLKYFDNLNTENVNDTYEYHKKYQWPYRIRIKNITSSKYGPCCFCLKDDCDDCLLPFDDNKTIGQIISNIPKNEEIEIDNTYLYLTEKQKNYVGNNKDLQLEVTWLNEYSIIVHKLNDKRDYDFKIIRSTKSTSVSIFDCFKNFVKLEKLEENNEWYCPECKKFQKATKKMEIFKIPHILIIHLKRFKNNSKIDTLVDFPIKGMDISQYVISNQDGLPQIYDLFAIANHFGGMGFGHYTSYSKNPIDKTWYDFDDSHVSKKSEDDLVNSSAYVLFYRRRDLEQYINTDLIYNKKFINYEQQTNSETQVTSNNTLSNNIDNYDPSAVPNSNVNIDEDDKLFIDQNNN